MNHGASSDFIWGRHPVMEQLNSSPNLVEHIWLTESVYASEEVRSLIRKARLTGLSFTIVDKIALDRLSKHQKHQGIVARCSVRPLLDFDDWSKMILDKTGFSLVLLLDRVQDPQNLGAIFRSAAAVPVDAVIVSKSHSAPFSSAAMKSSAGTLNHVPAIRVGNLQNIIERLKEMGYWIVGLTQEAGTVIYDFAFPEKTVLVVGGEDSGVRRLQRESCDALISIPMKGPAGSLNVSVSTGIALYQFLRSNYQKRMI
jgi:23S rRNA (guanosine2251-2'-O)-methyltransferase